MAIALTAIVLVASAVGRSAFPMGDPAIFEYIGHSLANGGHLYTDLWDNKLPSIYYVNALWWVAFGPNYRLHVLAETAINAGTLVLFAYLMRAFGVSRWALSTLVFAVFYLFIGGPLDQTEHYATPLILAGVVLGVRGRSILAAVALVCASTFWVPSIVIGIVPLLTISNPRQRVRLIVASVVAASAYAAAFVGMFGATTSTELARSWFSYQVGNYVSSASPATHRYPLPFLSPRYYIESGLALMVALTALFWRPNGSREVRFALVWAATTLAVVFALGRPSIHYFLPLYAPLAMLLCLQPMSFDALRNRWYVSAAVAACCVLMVAFGVRDSRRTFFGTPAAISYTGDRVRAAFGPGAVALMPWELYLTSDAVPPSRFFLAQGNVKFAKDRDRWVRQPIVFVDADDLRFNGVEPPADLHFVCKSALTLPYVIHADKPIAGIPCEHS